MRLLRLGGVHYLMLQAMSALTCLPARALAETDGHDVFAFSRDESTYRPGFTKNRYGTPPDPTLRCAISWPVRVDSRATPAKYATPPPPGGGGPPPTTR